MKQPGVGVHTKAFTSSQLRVSAQVCYVYLQTKAADSIPGCGAGCVTGTDLLSNLL